MKKAKQYFVHTQKDRNSSLWVVFVCLLFLLCPFFYALIAKGKVVDRSFQNEIAGLDELPSYQNDTGYSSMPYERTPHEQSYPYNKKNYYSAEDKENFTGALFNFDPNTASEEDWKKLGLRQKSVNAVLKMVKGGWHFYKPDDIRKIYGLSPGLADRIVPFVKIEKQNYTQSQASTYTPFEKKPYTPKTIAPVELNTADTSALIALPAIGSKLAQRIILFREKLGGFYTVDQVKEVYGIPDSTFQKIVPYLNVNASAVTKIKINDANVEDLKKHPYFRSIASAIVSYKNQHGKFSSAADLEKLHALTPADISKILPYISFE